MGEPLSPAAVKGGGRTELPAYLSNGVIGLRVRESPLGLNTGEWLYRRTPDSTN